MIADADWLAFQDEILDIASVFVEIKKLKYAEVNPSNIVRQLKAIDRALTAALQTLGGLELEHQEGQDISVKPFNWPVVQSLGVGRFVVRVQTCKPPLEIPAYPTDVIESLRELRDAARKATEIKNPKRGNSAHRNPVSKRRAALAKNFVFKYRSRFGHMPPMSKTGHVVELLQKMLNAAGEGDDADAGALLRQAIENDEAGHQLLRARHAKSAKRSK